MKEKENFLGEISMERNKETIKSLDKRRNFYFITFDNFPSEVSSKKSDLSDNQLSQSFADGKLCSSPSLSPDNPNNYNAESRVRQIEEISFLSSQSEKKETQHRRIFISNTYRGSWVKRYLE